MRQQLALRMMLGKTSCLRHPLRREPCAEAQLALPVMVPEEPRGIGMPRSFTSWRDVSTLSRTAAPHKQSSHARTHTERHTPVCVCILVVWVSLGRSLCSSGGCERPNAPNPSAQN